MQSFNFSPRIPIRCMFCLLCFSSASSCVEERGSMNHRAQRTGRESTVGRSSTYLGRQKRQHLLLDNRQKRRIKYNKIFLNIQEMESCQEPKSMSKLQRELKAISGEAVTGPSGAGVDTHTHAGRRSTALHWGREELPEGAYTPSLDPWRPVQSAERWSWKSLLEHGHTENHLSFSTWVWTGMLPTEASPRTGVGFKWTLPVQYGNLWPRN